MPPRSSKKRPFPAPEIHITSSSSSTFSSSSSSSSADPPLQSQAQHRADVKRYREDAARAAQEEIEHLLAELKKNEAAMNDDDGSPVNPSTTHVESEIKDLEHFLSSSHSRHENHLQARREKYTVKLHREALAREIAVSSTSASGHPGLALARLCSLRQFGPSAIYHEFNRLLACGYEPGVVFQMINNASKNKNSSPIPSSRSSVTELLEAEKMYQTEFLWAQAQAMRASTLPGGALYELSRLPTATVEDKAQFHKCAALASAWEDKRNSLLGPASAAGSGGRGVGVGEMELEKIRKDFIQYNREQGVSSSSSKVDADGDDEDEVDEDEDNEDEDSEDEDDAGVDDEDEEDDDTEMKAGEDAVSAHTSMDAVHKAATDLIYQTSLLSAKFGVRNLIELIPQGKDVGVTVAVSSTMITEVDSITGSQIIRGHVFVLNEQKPIKDAIRDSEFQAGLGLVFDILTDGGGDFHNFHPLQCWNYTGQIRGGKSKIAKYNSAGVRRCPLGGPDHGVSGKTGGTGRQYHTGATSKSKSLRLTPVCEARLVETTLTYPGGGTGCPVVVMRMKGPHFPNILAFLRAVVREEQKQPAPSSQSPLRPPSVWSFFSTGIVLQTQSLPLPLLAADPPLQSQAAHQADVKRYREDAARAAQEEIENLMGKLAKNEAAMNDADSLENPSTTHVESEIKDLEHFLSSSHSRHENHLQARREKYTVKLHKEALAREISVSSTSASIPPGLALARLCSLRQFGPSAIYHEFNRLLACGYEPEIVFQMIKNASKNKKTSPIPSSRSSVTELLEAEKMYQTEFLWAQAQAMRASTLPGGALYELNRLPTATEADKAQFHKCSALASAWVEKRNSLLEPTAAAGSGEGGGVGVDALELEKIRKDFIQYNREQVGPQLSLTDMYSVIQNVCDSLKSTNGVKFPLLAAILTRFSSSVLSKSAVNDFYYKNTGEKCAICPTLQHLFSVKGSKKAVESFLIGELKKAKEDKDKKDAGVKDKKDAGVDDEAEEVADTEMKAGEDAVSAHTSMDAVHKAATDLIYQTSLLSAKFGVRNLIELIPQREDIGVTVAVSSTMLTEVDSITGEQIIRGHVFVLNEQKRIVDAIRDSEFQAGLGLVFDILTDGGGDFHNFHPLQCWNYTGQIRGGKSNTSEYNSAGVRRCPLGGPDNGVSGKTGGTRRSYATGAQSQSESLRQTKFCEARLVETTLTYPGGGTGCPAVVMRMKGSHFPNILAFLRAVVREEQKQPAPSSQSPLRPPSVWSNFSPGLASSEIDD